MKTITQKCLRRVIAVNVGIDHFVGLFFWLNYVARQHSEKTKTNAVWTTITIQGMISVLEPGARFSKVPKLFGRISGDIFLFVSSKQRRLEARNFAVILNSIPFTTYQKTGFTE